jgi:inosine-uridine nucleoside N-ribohydrolase
MPSCSLYRLLAGITLGMCLWAQAPRRVIVDTDAGADDLLAILFLLKRQDVQIEAITVVHGLAHPVAGAETIARLLAFTQHSAIPIFIGASKPLDGSGEFPPEWRAAADQLLRQLPAPTITPAKDSAVAFLKRRLLNGPPVDILALGPLTNFALALRDEPRLGRPIREVVWMGGTLNAPGNVPTAPSAEWNSYLDPLAVERILATGWKLRFIGLDATSQVPITLTDLERMEALRTTDAAWLAVEILRTEAASIAQGRYFAWDPLAAVLLLTPALAQYENAALDVRKRAGERGRLLRVPALKPNVSYATTVQTDQFKRLFWSVMLL